MTLTSFDNGYVVEAIL